MCFAIAKITNAAKTPLMVSDPLLFRKGRLSVQLRTGIALSVSFALFLLAFGSSAEAAPIFTACGAGSDCVDEPEPITMRRGFLSRSIEPSARFSGSGETEVLTAAESTPLGLKASAALFLFATGTGGAANGGGSAYAAVLYDDFLVSASGASFDPGSLSLPVSLNLWLSGSLGTGVSATGSGGLIADGFAGAGVTVGMTVNGTYVEGGAFEGRSPSGVSYSTYGPLTDLTFPALFTTPVLNVPFLTPFSVRLELNPFSSAAAIIRGTPEDEFSLANFSITGSSAFESTLTFPTIGPVFNLPEGFTVNSPSALIVNNRFVGGSPAAAVPEPSSIFLFGLGLALVGLGRRAWKRRLHCSSPSASPSPCR